LWSGKNGTLEKGKSLRQLLCRGAKEQGRKKKEEAYGQKQEKFSSAPLLPCSPAILTPPTLQLNKRAILVWEKVKGEGVKVNMKPFPNTFSPKPEKYCLQRFNN
jgi:hypothetical protein